MCFADLVGILFPENENLELVQDGCKKSIQFEGRLYNPINDNDLERLDRINQITWNTQFIISFLRRTPSIKTIYFTRSIRGRWESQINEIRNACQNIEIIPIYTPSARGGALHQQAGILGHGKMIPLLHHWVHNNHPNYGNLDNDWLENHGVTLENF